nr:tetratricopeptide-like helical domain-containing protein [Tanacetum cinerariifolium]
MYAMVLFLIVITSTSSTLCVSSNNKNGDPEIYMVVDDQRTTMHDSRISKANPIQIGKFLLEDRKVLTLSRKSSPGRNCVGPDQPCGALDSCCEGLNCDGFFDGRCHPDPFCSPQGGGCALLSPCCYPYTCSGPIRGSTCL